MSGWLNVQAAFKPPHWCRRTRGRVGVARRHNLAGDGSQRGLYLFDFNLDEQ